MGNKNVRFRLFVSFFDFETTGGTAFRFFLDNWGKTDMTTTFSAVNFCEVYPWILVTPDGGYPYLVSILRIGMCPVSLGKILCHCVTKEAAQI